MIKQIILLITTICVAVYLLVYSEFFTFDFSSDQLEAFYKMFYLYLSASTYSFVAGELTKNYSQVELQSMILMQMM